MAGSDSTSSPHEIVLASYGACLTVGYALNAARQGIDLQDMQVQLEGLIDLPGFLGLEGVSNLEDMPGYKLIRARVTVSRDAYEILTERHRSGSVIVTSNRTPDEWLAAFADPLRAQSAIDRFSNHAYDFVIEGESYRSRLKPSLSSRDASRSLHA